MFHTIKKPSYAKINLHLKVTGLREDGYCQLETFFQEISLADSITISFLEDRPGLVDLACYPNLCAVEDNLAYKAARLFLEAFACRFSVKIQMIKNIPVGAGLGGGSSNAGTILLALAEYAGIDRKHLFALAQKLGADVPFFLWGGLAYAEERGDKVQTIPYFYDRVYLIVSPTVKVYTAKVFAHLKQFLTTKIDHNITLDALDFFLRLIDREDPLAFENDLEEATFFLYPQLRLMKRKLEKITEHSVQMSGSGAAFFVECASESVGENLVKRIKSKGYLGFIARPVSRESFRKKEAKCEHHRG